MASVVSLSAAYMDKIKEMSMLSLICSCFNTQPRPTSLVQYEGVQAQTQSVNKRASGQAFEVYLEAPMDPSPDKPKSKAPLRKELSLEQLQQRLGAADQRRKSQEAAVLQQLAEKREHERAVLRKALEESRSFSRRAEEKLSHKLEVIKENREAHLNALKQRLQQKEAHAAQVRRNKEVQSDYSG
ncbi:stathmin-3 isoform X1 [Gadus macrocephalus]|uniref:stathmin-3 isoform X1 n=1 Tax=Gadus macrocephalus TaxID=80720 RepID=UPI0028CB96CD|nr:stathmin-3 isoform X1 [Gadus macrocephalus]